MKSNANANRFRNLIDAAGFTQAELARRVSVHPNTVTNWSNGQRMPGAVIAYLRLYAKVKDLLNE